MQTHVGQKHDLKHGPRIERNSQRGDGDQLSCVQHEAECSSWQRLDAPLGSQVNNEETLADLTNRLFPPHRTGEDVSEPRFDQGMFSTLKRLSVVALQHVEDPPHFALGVLEYSVVVESMHEAF
ncbi:hypothetical protein MMC12_003320 [Toensbergia leucococca]|nr:hypothetical protein [Toensbergia leucococca]